MEIITVLTARAEPPIDLPWAQNTHYAVLIAVQHPLPKLRVTHFAAYIYDDHGKMIGQSEGSMSQLAGLKHQFVHAIQPRSAPVSANVVPIGPPPPPNPPGHDYSPIARAMHAIVIQADGSG